MTTIIDGSSGIIYPTGTTQQGSLTLGNAQSASGTSVEFTNIPSWVKKITVMLNGISTNSTSLVQLQLGTLSGYETTNYVWIGAYSGGSNGAGGYSITTGIGIDNGISGSASVIRHGILSILNSSNNTWTYSHNGSLYTGSTNFAVNGAGYKTISDTLDRIRLTTINGTDTFDAGTINIMYE